MALTAERALCGIGAANLAPAVSSALAWKTPSGRRAAWLVVANADEIDETERRFVDALIVGSTELAHLIDLAWEFRAMVRKQQEERLDDWLAAAEKTTFAGIVGGLRRDLPAVRAALSLSWSTGSVAGQICHLKTIKHTMCGRAGLTCYVIVFSMQHDAGACKSVRSADLLHRV